MGKKGIHIIARWFSFIPTWASVTAVLALIFGLLKWKFGSGTTFKSNRRLFGRVAIVTGADAGTGRAVAQDLAERGATVILACQDPCAGEEAVRDIQRDTKNTDVKFIHLDLSSFNSIRNFANEFQSSEKRLDILINNAAAVCAKKTTEDRLDYVMCVNYVGPFYLTKLLLPTLKKSSPSRLVNLSSDSWEKGSLDLDDLNYEKRKDSYNMSQTYADSKLAITLWTHEIGKRNQGTVSCYAANPGWVCTDLHMNTGGLFGIALQIFAQIFFRSAEMGAQTVIYCAVRNNLEKHSGRYFNDCGLEEITIDNELARKLWAKTETLINSRIAGSLELKE